MSQIQAVGISLGVVLGCAFIMLGCIVARRKQMYLSFIPGMAESRDRLAARYDPKKSIHKKQKTVPLKPYHWKTNHSTIPPNDATTDLVAEPSKSVAALR